MEIVQSILAFINKPFPRPARGLTWLRNNICISIFVTLFLYVFQPFGISNAGSNNFLICLGFGGVSFMASLLHELSIGRLFCRQNNESQFTFGKWIFNVMLLILLISLFNFFYARYLMGSMRWDHLPAMMYGTFAIAIFPVVVLGGFAMIKSEKKYQQIAETFNLSQREKVAEKKPLSLLFDVPIKSIKYIEAMQNYVKIGYIDTEGHFKEKTERATLKGILDENESGAIIKCHRSFLVNKEAIVSTKGNAQGLILSLSECNKHIPVSRSFVKTFKAS